MRRNWILFICATALLYGCAATPEPEPAILSVPELIADWRAHDRSVVRVRGQVDECVGWYCQLCPEDMTFETFDGQKCVDFSFPEWPDERLLRQTHRFATVVLEGNFADSCGSFARREPNPAGEIWEVLCTDGPADIENARVLEIVARRSAVNGLVSRGDSIPLVVAQPPQREEMFAAFGAAFCFECQSSHLPMGAEFFVFPEDVEGRVPVHGVACACYEEDCDGPWPSRFSYGMSSPGNPFECWGMIRREGRWQVVLNAIE